MPPFQRKSYNNSNAGGAPYSRGGGNSYRGGRGGSRGRSSWGNGNGGGEEAAGSSTPAVTLNVSPTPAA